MTDIDKKNQYQKLISFLVALCLFFATIENAIPKPLPFLRLGLANLPVIFSLFLLRKRDVFFLVLFKVVLQGIISGTIFSYIFLFSGVSSFSSALAMQILFLITKGDNSTNERKFLKISAIGLSLIGSLASTFSQLFLAKFFLFGENTKYIVPILLVSGLITGLFLGIFSEIFIQKSKWFETVRGIRYEL